MGREELLIRSKKTSLGSYFGSAEKEQLEPSGAVCARLPRALLQAPLPFPVEVLELTSFTELDVSCAKLLVCAFRHLCEGLMVCL